MILNLLFSLFFCSLAYASNVENLSDLNTDKVATLNDNFKALNDNANKSKNLLNDLFGANEILGTANGGTGLDNSATTANSIPYFSATGTMGNIGIGTTGQFLAYGTPPYWSAPVPAPGLTLKSTTTFTGAATSGTISLTTGKTYKIVGKFTTATNGQTATVLINGDSGTTYQRTGTASALSANVLTTGAAIANGTDCTLIMEIIPSQASNNNAYVDAKLLYINSGGAVYTSLSTTSLYQGASSIASFILNFTGTNATGTIWTYEFSGS